MKFSSYIIVSLFVLMAISPVLLIAPSVDAAPPPNGNWVVTGTETVNAGLYGLNDGNLIIQDGGVLTLDSADIMINDTVPGHLYVEVQDGGKLIMKNGATIRLRLLDNYINFYIRDGAQATITDSFIYDVGNLGGNLEDQGIYINSDDVTIDNTQVSRSSNALIIDDCNPTISNSNIENNWGFGMIIMGGKPTIKGNDIHDNGLAGYSWWWQWWHGIVADSTDAVIEGNTISNNGWQPSGGNRNGAGIWVAGGDTTIRNNTIKDNSYYGIHVDSIANGLIADNDISGNENGGIEVSDVSDMDILRNTIQSNTADGIRINGVSGSTLKNNTINVTTTNPSFNAVSIDGMSSPLFFDNDIYRWNAGDAVFVGGSSSPDFHGNTIFAENGDGFDISYFIDSKITNNVVNASQEALQIRYFCDIVANDNDLTSRTRMGLTSSRYSTVIGDNNHIRSNWEAVQVSDHSKLTLTNSDIYAPDDVGVVAGSRSIARIASSTIRSDHAWGLFASESSIDIINSTITAPQDLDMYIGNGLATSPSYIRTVNTTFNQSSVAFGNTYADLDVFWYATKINAEWQNGMAVAGADVDILDVNGASVYNGTTDPNGEINWLLVREYTQNNTRRLDFTRHNFTASMNGITGFFGANVNQNVKVRIILNDILNDPKVSIANPIDGGVYNSSNVWVNGTAIDPESGISKVDVTPNGQSPVTANGTYDWGTTLNLTDGDWDLDVVATNHAGVSTTDSVSITVDTVPPTLTVSYPPATDLVNTTNVTVIGTTEPGAVLTVMGLATTVGTNGSFSIDLNLSEGVNVIVVISHDEALNFAHSYHVVTVDTIPPELEVSTPPGDILTTEELLVTSGWTEADANLTINGDVVTHTGAPFSMDYLLYEGENNLSFDAMDPAGNHARLSRVVTLDTRAPELKVYDPPEDILTSEPKLNIEGWANDISLTSVTVNGQDVTVDEDGNFSLNLTLEEGMNIIDFEVIDEAGHVTNLRRIVELDTTPPPLEVFEPEDGLLTNEPDIMIKGSTEIGAKVEVDGVNTSVLGDATFEQGLHLEEGKNNISVTATDKAGNPTTVNLIVTLDTIAPTLTIKAPKKGESFSEYRTDLKGITEVGALVTVNGKVVKNNDGRFSIPLALLDGSNKLTVTSTDAAGNVATEELTVYREGFTGMESGLLGLGLLLLIAALVLALLLMRKRKGGPSSQPEYMDAMEQGPEPMGGPEDVPAVGDGPEEEPPESGPSEPEGSSTKAGSSLDRGSPNVEETGPQGPGPAAPDNPPAANQAKIESKEAEEEAPPSDDSHPGGDSKDGSLQDIMDKLG